jgi:hypothetical protein
MLNFLKINLNNYRQVFYLSVILFFSYKISAQNMVINSSFEKYSQCPSGFSQITRALTCTAPRGNLGEYFNSCSTDPAYSVPYQGGNNYQEAHFGDAYIACFMFHGIGSSYREYVQMELFTYLTNNSFYYVEFWANRAKGTSGGKYAVNNIGLSFQSDFTDTTHYSWGVPALLPYNADIMKYTNPIITDTLNWVKINGIYRSNGTEKYVILGNFFPDSETDTIDMLDGNSSASAYFFDDVLVEEITQPFWQYHDTLVYYGDSVLIGPALTGLEIDWYTDNLDFISNAPGIYVSPPTSRDYIAKETFNGVETEHVVHVTVIGGAGLEENELQNVRVFPNPSKGSFSISGITSDKPLQLEVRDVHGKLVFEEKAFSKELNSFALDVENGIYFVKVVDLESKGFVVEKLVVSR